MRENIRESFLKAVTSKLVFKEPGRVLLAEEGKRDGHVGLLRQGWFEGMMTFQGKTSISQGMEQTWNQDLCSGSACLICLLDICRNVKQAGRGMCLQFQGEDGWRSRFGSDWYIHGIYICKY